MNVGALTLRDLQYIVAVSKFSHFGRAAKELYISQPALSSQIRKIESVLGVSLFERTNRRVTLTVEGTKIAEIAHSVLSEAEKIFHFAEKHARGWQGPLRIGAIATLGPYYFPRLLPHLQKEYSNLHLQMEEGQTDTLLERLRSGHLDVILASDTFHDSAFVVIPIFFEPFVLIAPTGHLLLKKLYASVTDLRSTEMVFLEDGHCLKEQTIALCRRTKHVRLDEFHVGSLETLMAIVAAKRGYAILPTLAARIPRPLTGLIEFREFRPKKTGRTIVLAFRKSTARERDFRQLANYLIGHKPDETSSI